MTATQFRKLALEIDGAIESSHMGHPDFRIGGRIFATLGPGERWGVVMLVPAQQRKLISSHPAMFTPVPGKWGERGATKIILKPARVLPVRNAMRTAIENILGTSGQRD